MNTTLILQIDDLPKIGFELHRIWYMPWKKHWIRMTGIDAEMIAEGYRPSTDEEILCYDKFMVCE